MRARHVVYVLMLLVGAVVPSTWASGPPAATVNPSVGTVTVDQSIDAATYVETDTVTLSGSLAVHGWHHTGTVRGKGSEQEQFVGLNANTVNMTVASVDGVVTGACGMTDGDPTGGTDTGEIQHRTMRIHCLLTNGSAPPWPLTLTALVTAFTQPTGDHRVWTGRYAGADASATGPTAAAIPASFGVLAVTTGWRNLAGETEVGPVTLSGQIRFGSDHFSGDLTGPGPGWTTTGAAGVVPPFTISGTDARGSVTGTCSGTTTGLDPAGTEAFTDITCAVSRDGGPAATITINGPLIQDGRRGYSEVYDDSVYRVTTS